jgi:hypothetical protein
MSLAELINTFGNRVIYHYHGKKSDLEQILFSQSLSYNYVICEKDIYFICEEQPNHQLVELFYNPTENSGE